MVSSVRLVRRPLVVKKRSRRRGRMGVRKSAIKSATGLNRPAAPKRARRSRGTFTSSESRSNGWNASLF